MIKNRKQLQEYIRADQKANLVECHYLPKLFYGNDNARAFRYLKCLRHLEYAINTKSILVHYFRWKHRRLSLNYSIFIVPNTVGKGLYIPHLQDIIINCKRMGCNCIVGPMVVVGNKGSQDNIASIGDNVELTMGCKVVGRIQIGDNVIVAPNSVVIKDVPSNAVVSGVPAKTIKLNGKKII